ncbi:MAG: hypothetical protein ISQ92_05930 [Pelagibacteraceae bacterium]|jgi:hypothetical protein|nr:hypothetical protein [Pelagibacteraceae bacterium]|tara:strand:+ start:3933 stop:4151 length:219 start_codon:yes stop_codon:yes gene_type:complete
MIRTIIILFLLISPVNAKCKYYAYADVENNKIVNKKEKYICEEKENILVQFLTDEKYHQALTMVFITLLENI